MDPGPPKESPWRRFSIEAVKDTKRQGPRDDDSEQTQNLMEGRSKLRLQTSGYSRQTNAQAQKARRRFLHQVAANFFVDDNSLICRECRRTGCVVVRADPTAGEQGLIDDLENIQQNVESRDRRRLPVARQLASSSCLILAPRLKGGSVRVYPLVLTAPKGAALGAPAGVPRS